MRSAPSSRTSSARNASLDRAPSNTTTAPTASSWGSVFNQVEEVSVPVHREWTIESTLGYLYSTSFASRGLFGERIEEFEATVKDVLADHGHGGVFSEENEFLLRVGRRGKDGFLGKSLVR